MKLRKTIFLLALLGGVGAYYFLKTPPPPREDAEGGAARLLDLPEGDFAAWLEIERPRKKERIVLRREEGNWKLLEPLAYPAENFLVEGMISALTVGKSVKRFPVAEGGWPEFGLDSPEFRIGVSTEKDPVRRYLLIGGESPAGVGVYARWEEEKECLLIPHEIKASLDRSVYSLRRKKIFDFQGEEITWIGIKDGGKTVQLAKKGAAWRWVTPARPKEIPEEKVRDFLYSFRALYVKEFLDGEDPSQEKLGLKNGSTVLALGEDRRTRQTLIVGKALEEKDAFYARRETEHFPLLVARGNIRSVLEMAQELLKESQQDGNSGKTEPGSGKDPTGGGKGGKKSG